MDAKEKVCQCACERCKQAKTWAGHCNTCAFYGEDSVSEMPKKVMTVADIKKLTENFHRCGWDVGPVKNLNPECGCMCGTVYNEEGEPIIGHYGTRSGVRCQHTDERGRLPVIIKGGKPSPQGESAHLAHCEHAALPAECSVCLHGEAAPAEAIQPDISHGMVAPIEGGEVPTIISCADYTHPLYVTPEEKLLRNSESKPDAPQAEGAKNIPMSINQAYEWGKKQFEGPAAYYKRKYEELKASLESQPSSLAGTFEETNKFPPCPKCNCYHNRGQCQIGPASFHEFWSTDAKYYDPDTDEVPWYDKREALAEYVWNAARQQSQPVIEPLVSDAEIEQLINNINDFDGVHEVVECLKELQQFRKAQQERMR